MKENTKKMSTQTTNWEKILQYMYMTHTYDRGLISKL